jgi:RHS repeat-associated protein
MGCKRLNTDFFTFLEIVHSKKSASEEKKRINYYPFGLQHKGYNNTISSNGNSVAQKFGYNGKELNEELGLEWHDFGARNYDASLGRWMNIDPLSELKYEFTPYNYVQNSPMYRIDPDGLTDYTLNKKTGAVTEVEGTKTEDGIDRIVKTNRKGEIKTYKSGKKKGQSKVAIGGIEQGILKDGQNLKTDDTVIATGGDGQPTEDGVKSFALNLSEYIGKEIKGFSYSSNGSGDVTDMVLGKYMNNDYTTSYGTTNELSNKYGADFSLNNVVQQFHTHPDGKLGATQTAPGQSGDVKNLQKDKPFIPNASFIVLYRIVNQKSPGEYNYTHEYKGKKKR